MRSTGSTTAPWSWHARGTQVYMGLRELRIPPRLAVLAAVAGVILAVVVAVAMHDRHTVSVQYAQVTAGPLTREVLTSGTLQPAKAVDVGTQVSGTVQTLE